MNAVTPSACGDGAALLAPPQDAKPPRRRRSQPPRQAKPAGPWCSLEEAVPRPPCVAEAIAWLEWRVRDLPVLSSPGAVRDLLRLRIGHLEYEAFGLLFLDAQNRLIHIEEMFRGSLTQTSVYPREVVKTALRLNAAAVICYHNHPSGSTTPSLADQHLTHTLKGTLAMVDVKLLDHLVVTASDAVSLAERGML
jgi:DNA repair protein RadC